MKTGYTVAISILAGTALGATVMSGLYAQGKAAGAYTVIDISEITDVDTFKQLLPKGAAVVTASGGQFIMRTENIIARDGSPPKRFVVIAFDTMDKAKTWSSSAAQKEVDVLREKSTKSRSFIVEGSTN